MSVLTVAELPAGALAALLGGHGLRIVRVTAGAPIPGSHWGEPEAGLIGDAL